MAAFPYLLIIHSWLRWLVLATLILSLYRSWCGKRGGLPYTKTDHILRLSTATVAHLQLIAGIVLYFISPITDYFMHHFSEAVHERQIRFFGMEHSLVMLLAITVLTIGSAKAKRKKTDAEKHRTVAVWYTIALLLILSSIPWAFSPLTARPWIRW